MYQHYSPFPDDNWAWPDRNSGWDKVAVEKFQKFYDHWRTTPTDFDSHVEFPYKLPLGAGMPFNPGTTSENQILVTKSYNNIFHRILRLRENFLGTNKGVVLTGQPGVGASL